MQQVDRALLLVRKILPTWKKISLGDSAKETKNSPYKSDQLKTDLESAFSLEDVIDRLVKDGRIKDVASVLPIVRANQARFIKDITQYIHTDSAEKVVKDAENMGEELYESGFSSANLKMAYERAKEVEDGSLRISKELKRNFEDEIKKAEQRELSEKVEKVKGSYRFWQRSSLVAALGVSALLGLQIFQDERAIGQAESDLQKHYRYTDVRNMESAQRYIEEAQYDIEPWFPDLPMHPFIDGKAAAEKVRAAKSLVGNAGPLPPSLVKVANSLDYADPTKQKTISQPYWRERSALDSIHVGLKRDISYSWDYLPRSLVLDLNKFTYNKNVHSNILGAVITGEVGLSLALRELFRRRIAAIKQ